MSRPFEARYGGRCAADCGGPIREGDQVVFVDDELVHTACVEAMDDERSHRRPDPVVCPSCWIAHAGECM